MASETPPDGVGSAFQSSDLDEPMTKFGFSNDVRAKLLEENFDTASFAMIALTLMELDTIIKAYEADLQREFTRKEVAAFRQLWQFCQQKAQPATPQPLAASASTAPPSIASGWSETFPAKLDADMLRQMRLDFETAYPSELLDPNSMPGARLLALTAHQLKEGEWKWIPWTMRLSQSQHELHVSNRPKKLAKLESIQMTELLLDEVPSRDLPSQMGIAQLTQVLMLQAFAIALCKGAHLHVLKTYVAKFVRLATQGMKQILICAIHPHRNVCLQINRCGQRSLIWFICGGGPWMMPFTNLRTSEVISMPFYSQGLQ
jgi:hypothetical protein